MGGEAFSSYLCEHKKGQGLFFSLAAAPSKGFGEVAKGARDGWDTWGLGTGSIVVNIVWTRIIPETDRYDAIGRGASSLRRACCKSSSTTVAPPKKVVYPRVFWLLALVVWPSSGVSAPPVGHRRIACCPLDSRTSRRTAAAGG